MCLGQITATCGCLFDPLGCWPVVSSYIITKNVHKENSASCTSYELCDKFEIPEVLIESKMPSQFCRL